jgi:endonuclease/exonuclease/phosphatase family metal-dependent hydrolase
MTWNLWWRYGPWQRRRAAIAEVLAGVAPDVCGLQEVWGGPDANFAAELAERLGMHWCWVELPPVARRHPEHGVLAIGNAVLSRWPIADRAELALPTADVEERRAALYARIEAPGGPFPFFTTHLTYRPGGSALRVAQVRALAGFVDKNAADAAYPPVVTGDLNAEPDSDEIRLLSGMLTAPAVPDLVLLDAWRYADPADPGFTWHHRNGYQKQSRIPDSRIDYVFVGLPSYNQDRGRVRSVRLAGTEPVDGVWASDHFAVVAELED